MSYPISILSRPCIPFVIGYSVTHAQMVDLGTRLCTEEQQRKVPERPDVAKDEAVIRHQEPDGEIRYLWVKGVVPSFSGECPKVEVPPLDFSVYPTLEGLEDVRPRCIVWPNQLCVPDWFCPRLTSFVKFLAERREKKRAQLASASDI
ncbi:hypothetical protein R3P38DRAFT_3531825 [Favolaschia claudopus]|uniref:Uncharacterized protein n=1 Tax=Favolaschia claudopus TaxID=2862362 RepID=A0AAW0BKR6_9AGAR